MSTIAEIASEIAACQKCPLATGRFRTVPGEGPESARILFIGEAPGWHENQQGRPFVGAAGQFLDELLASIGLDRSRVFITNIVKCRPPGNRDPEPEEVEACRDYLDRQIAALQPSLVVTLGRHSLGKFFPGEKISRIHGIARRVDGVVYFPMYHPAAALHKGDLRATVVADMQKIPGLLAEAVEVAEAEKTEVGEQLSLF